MDVINDILEISRFDSGKPELTDEIFDPAGLCDIVRLMEPQAAQQRVTLSWQCTAEIPLICADRRRMRQMLLNLISNALKFTPAGGTVKVILLAKVGEGLELAVQDNGIGIAAEDLAKALEPFSQVDSSLSRKYEGTGLGLPLTRQLAELHGGSLRLQSERGVGTRVTIHLPAWRLRERADAA